MWPGSMRHPPAVAVACKKITKQTRAEQAELSVRIRNGLSDQRLILDGLANRIKATVETIKICLTDNAYRT